MKKNLAILALALSPVVHAEELFFGDTNYFLKAKQINLTANMDMTSNQSRIGTGSDIETEGYLAGSRLAYAFTDQFNIFLLADYSYDMEVTGGDRTYQQDGLNNPGFGANYRLLSQNDSLFNLDFGAISKVGIEDQEIGSADPNKDGNAANGRDSLELNTRIGKKWNIANEWQLAGGVVYNHEGEYSQLGSSTEKYDVDSSMDLYLKATYQYRPVHEFMFAFSALGTRVGELNSKNKSTTAKSSEDAHIDYDFLFNAKYLITDNFIFKFNYGQGMNPDYDMKDEGTSTERLRRRESLIGLGVDFLF